eukprot:gene10767-11967_t
MKKETKGKKLPALRIELRAADGPPHPVVRISRCGRGKFALRTGLFVLSALAEWHSTDLLEVITSSNVRGPAIVLLIDRLGLGNRLGAMADWFVIARLSGRQLIVGWRRTTDCNIQFNEMFASSPADLHVASSDSLFLSEKNVLERIAEAAQSVNKTVQFIDNDTSTWAGNGKFPNIVSLSIYDKAEHYHHLLVTNHIGFVTMEGLSCQLYLSLRSSFLSSLEPLPSIKEAVDHILCHHFASSIPVGVHIRTHNPLFDWAIIPPKQGTQALRFGETSNTSVFIDLMKTIQKHFNGQSKENNNFVKFFVASNSHTVKEELVSVFGVNAAVALIGDAHRNSSDGMMFAFHEWLILSHCELLINSWGSTFALEAAQRFLKPIVGIWYDVALLSSNMYTPQCSNLQFFIHYETPLQVNSIIEDTVDKRKVKTMTFDLQPSSWLASFGLPQVFVPVPSSYPNP